VFPRPGFICLKPTTCRSFDIVAALGPRLLKGPSIRRFISLTPTRRFNDLKWGTNKTRSSCADPEFAPWRLRSYGHYSFKVSDPARFLTEIVPGTGGEFTMDEIKLSIRNIIVQEIFAQHRRVPNIPVTGNMGRQYPGTANW